MGLREGERERREREREREKNIERIVIMIIKEELRQIHYHKYTERERMREIEV